MNDRRTGAIDKELRQRLIQLGAAFQAEKLVLFGSRARGDHRPRSDIDLAVYGLPASQQPAFTEAVEQLPTLLDFDVVFISPKTPEGLRQNVERDGIVLMARITERLTQLTRAIARLEEAIAEYAQAGLSSSRDGVIQRFEFCAELAWKAARDYMLAEGYTEINSPKAVMRTAFADGLIDDEAGWLALLNARNLTSHLYDEAAAEELFSAIQTKYLRLLRELTDKLSG